MPETKGYSLEFIQEGFQALHGGRRSYPSRAARTEERDREERSSAGKLGKHVKRLLTGPVLFPDGIGEAVTTSMDLDQGQVQAPLPTVGGGGLLRFEMGTV